MPKLQIDAQIRAKAEARIAEGGDGRVVKVLRALLDTGSISTDELSALGYGHPPRAAADVKDIGIPIVKTMVVSERTGRRMAVYSFGDPSQIQEGHVGRQLLPKSFKKELVGRYGSIDCITGATLNERVLQMDHRIPYRIVGDTGAPDVEDFMLLDGSSQRAKSFSCENCPNWNNRDPKICKTCFWAFPENYQHIATVPYRRVDVTWQDADVPVHDALKKEADGLKIPVAELIRRIIRQRAKRS